jgi:hypothetical protein
VVYQGSFFPIVSPIFVVGGVLDGSHSNRSEVEFSCAFLCISFMTRDDEHFLLLLYWGTLWYLKSSYHSWIHSLSSSYLIPFCHLDFFLWKALLSSFAISSLGHWFWGNLVFWAPCIFWLLIPCQMYSWKIFSPILWAPPKSGDHFLFSINYFEFFCQNRLAFSFCTILLLCWVYIVTFTKFLTIYHWWIHPSITLLYYPPHSWNNFNMSHFSIFIYEYTIISWHSVSVTLSLYPSPSHRKTCFTFLFCFWRKGIFECLR